MYAGESEQEEQKKYCVAFALMRLASGQVAVPCSDDAYKMLT